MGGKGSKGMRGAPLSLLPACDARQKFESSNQQRAVATCRGRGAPTHGVFLIPGSYRVVADYCRAPTSAVDTRGREGVAG